MSQNNPTGGTNQGTPSTTTGTDNQSLTTGTQSTGGGTGAATAPGLATTAQEYGQKIADAATTAKDYVTDKVSVVRDKLKDLQNTDIKKWLIKAKDYARENPGQAIIISAAAGLVLGLLLRGSRR